MRLRIPNEAGGIGRCTQPRRKREAAHAHGHAEGGLKEVIMPWILLLAAGLLEIVMALALKQTEGWTRLWPSGICIAAALGSLFLLAQAVKSLPTATAYAVWTGIGAIGVTLAGMTFFHESSSPARLLCLLAIFAGIIGLRVLEA